LTRGEWGVIPGFFILCAPARTCRRFPAGARSCPCASTQEGIPPHTHPAHGEAQPLNDRGPGAPNVVQTGNLVNLTSLDPGRPGWPQTACSPAPQGPAWNRQRKCRLTLLRPRRGRSYLLVACGGAITGFFSMFQVFPGDIRMRPLPGRRKGKRLLARPYGHLRPHPGQTQASQVSQTGLFSRLHLGAWAPRETVATKPTPFLEKILPSAGQSGVSERSGGFS